MLQNKTSAKEWSLSRRELLAGAIVGAALPCQAAYAMTETKGGNPLLPGQGVCDPQIRIFGDAAYMYSTHDAGRDVPYFTMHDWQIWRSTDLVDWSLAGTLRPEQTYLGKPSSECWATDAISRHGRYYLYVSMGPDNIGVVMADTPAGPWHDPLGKPMIAKGDVPTASRDPGILQEADGTSYIVFGTFDYYIARLGDDMISLAETPRKIEVHNPDGPFGPGRTDDKPFMHRRGDVYYLSWGSYYAMGTSPYGPFNCVGALFARENVEPPFLDDSGMRGPQAPPPQYRPVDWLNYDRHGSFFDWHGQSYFACNDQSGPGQSPLFRNSALCYVHYRADGTIVPLRLTKQGVGRHDLRQGIKAAEFSALQRGKKIVEQDIASVQIEDGGTIAFDHTQGKRGMLYLSGHPQNGNVRIAAFADGKMLGTMRRKGQGWALVLSHWPKACRLMLSVAGGAVKIEGMHLA